MQRGRVPRVALSAWRRRVAGVLAAAALCPAALAQSTDEAVLKARLVLNLARFTQWPGATGADEALVLCALVQTEAQRAAMHALEGQQIGARRVRVLVNPASPAAACHVLFIEGTAERALPLLTVLAERPVLTVGEGPSFIQRGMVALVNVDDALRFDVQLKRLRAAQLDLSSKVLRLARQVVE